MTNPPGVAAMPACAGGGASVQNKPCAGMTSEIFWACATGAAATEHNASAQMPAPMDVVMVMVVVSLAAGLAMAI